MSIKLNDSSELYEEYLKQADITDTRWYVEARNVKVSEAWREQPRKKNSRCQKYNINRRVVINAINSQ